MKPRLEGLAQIVIAIGIFVVVILLSSQISELKEWGYVGAFAIMLLSNATIVLPAPGWALIAAMAANSAFNPIILGIAAGLGSGIGEITGFLAGDGAASIIMKNKLQYRKFKNIIRKYDMAGIFALAIIPGPFDIAGIVAGSVGIPITRFLVAVIAGRIIRFVLVALGIAAFLAPAA